jgi:hypothetical protein
MAPRHHCFQYRAAKKAFDLVYQLQLRQNTRLEAFRWTRPTAELNQHDDEVRLFAGVFVYPIEPLGRMQLMQLPQPTRRRVQRLNTP